MRALDRLGRTLAGAALRWQEIETDQPMREQRYEMLPWSATDEAKTVGFRIEVADHVRGEIIEYAVTITETGSGR